MVRRLHADIQACMVAKQETHYAVVIIRKSHASVDDAIIVWLNGKLAPGLGMHVKVDIITLAPVLDLQILQTST